MIEKTVLAYLNEKLDVSVYAEEPATKESSYCILQTIDAGRKNYINKVTVVIRSYAPSLQEAGELYTRVKEAMYGINALDNVSSAKLGGGGQAIDEATDRYAYDCVFNLVYMED